MRLAEFNRSKSNIAIEVEWIGIESTVINSEATQNSSIWGINAGLTTSKAFETNQIDKGRKGVLLLGVESTVINSEATQNSSIWGINAGLCEPILNLTRYWKRGYKNKSSI